MELNAVKSAAAGPDVPPGPAARERAATGPAGQPDREVDVLVAGAGPTGLVLAVELLRRGVSALLVERGSALFPGSRGKGLQPRTREVLDDLGVGAAVTAAGGPYPMMRTWRDGAPVRDWDLMERPGPVPGAPYHEAWMVPQWRTQELLHARLRELGGEAVLDAALTGLTQDEEGVTARLAAADGAGAGGRTVRARYLVGADGGRSTVRRLLGIGMTGETVDPTPWLVADVRLAGDGPGREHWHMWPDEESGRIALCPLPGTPDFQLAAPLPAPAAPDAAGPAAVRALVAARTHLTPEQVTEVRWASVFTARAALADRYRSGRVLLAGDAAHVHSPAGGQGLNTGVQDAHNLGWKLAAALRPGTPAPVAEALLDSYEAERRAIAAGVLGLSTRIHRAGQGTDNPAARRGRETFQLDHTHRDGPLSADVRAAPDGTLRAGDRAPDADCRAADGSAVRLFDAFHGPHFTLLACGGARLPEHVPEDCRALSVTGLPPHARAAYGTGLFLVRPDGYLGAAADGPDGLLPLLDRFGLTAPAPADAGRR